MLFGLQRKYKSGGCPGGSPSIGLSSDQRDQLRRIEKLKNAEDIYQKKLTSRILESRGLPTSPPTRRPDVRSLSDDQPNVVRRITNLFTRKGKSSVDP